MERPGAAFRCWDFAALRKANAEWTQTISWLLLLHWFGAAVSGARQRMRSSLGSLSTTYATRRRR